MQKNNIMHRHILCRICHIVFAMFSLLSCTDKKTVELIYQPAEKYIVDSFLVKGIVSRCELQRFHFLNDSCLVSHNAETGDVNFYRKQSSGKVFTFSHRFPVSPSGYIRNFFIQQDTNFYTCNDSNLLYAYQPTGLRTREAPYPIKAEFKHLGNQFLLYHKTSGPMQLRNDSLFSAYGYNDFSLFQQFCKEPVLALFIREEGEFRLKQTYVSKPSAYHRFGLSLPSFVLGNSEVIVLFPFYDTLYVQSLAEKEVKKIPIHNKDYTCPGYFDINRMKDNSYSSKYLLHSFNYNSIYYNSLTKHYILFYNKALPEYNEKNDLPTFSDLRQCALVLSADFKPLRYLSFNSTYADLENRNFIKNRGFMMAEENGQNNYVNTTFYIYNL